MVFKILGLCVFWFLSLFVITSVFLGTINVPSTLVNILGLIITLGLIAVFIKINIVIFNKLKKDVKNV
jgi:hypothetical protein